MNKLDLFLAIASGVLVFSGSPSLATAAVTCVDGPNVRVRISGQLFAVPVNYRPKIVEIRERKVYAPEICSGKSIMKEVPLAQLIDAHTLQISIFDSRVIHDKYTQTINAVILELWSSSASISRSKNNFNDIRKRILNGGRKLEDLPRFGKFYAFAVNPDRPERLGDFIAIEGGPLTPDGFPLVVHCIALTAQPNKQIIAQPGEMCQVSYAWSRGISVFYTFHYRKYSLENWATLDLAVRDFVRHLMVTDGGG